MERLQCQPDLLEIVHALGSPARFAGGIDRRHQQPDEYADDGDDDQELDERKTLFVEKSLWQID